jgi:hypothetical protein
MEIKEKKLEFKKGYNIIPAIISVDNGICQLYSKTRESSYIFKRYKIILSIIAIHSKTYKFY